MPLTVERFRICELYAELLHCSSLSLLNRPPNYGPLYDGEGRLTGGLGGLEELARVISQNGSDAPESETPPAAPTRDLTEEGDSPIASRGTMSSSVQSSEGDTSSLSHSLSDSGRATDGSESYSDRDSDDLGAMEEIDVHEEHTIELRIPHSPQPSREPLPPAPFAVPSPRSQPAPLPEASTDETSSETTESPGHLEELSGSPSSISTALPRTSEPEASAVDVDIDPFADPNEGSSKPSVDLSASITSTSLDDSRLLQAALEESVEPGVMRTVVPQRRMAPPGEVFKEKLLDLGVLNTLLVWPTTLSELQTHF